MHVPKTHTFATDSQVEQDRCWRILTICSARLSAVIAVLVCIPANHGKGHRCCKLYILGKYALASKIWQQSDFAKNTYEILRESSCVFLHQNAPCNTCASSEVMLQAITHAVQMYGMNLEIHQVALAIRHVNQFAHGYNRLMGSYRARNDAVR